MNKKYGILFVFVLLAGAVFLSACQSEVGGRINKNFADNRQAVDVGGGGGRNNPLSNIYQCCGTYGGNKGCYSYKVGSCSDDNACPDGTETCEDATLEL
jgi:hypothetical protein